MDISLIIVCRNESRYIVECIRSVEQQFTNSDEWELLLVDGCSEDNTVELAQNYLKSNAAYTWQIIRNEGKTLARGWNLGIKAARGKYIIRPDAHATLHPGYIENVKAVLDSKSDVGAAGGILETKAKGTWGQIIKEALSSKVGVGNSSFRVANESAYADTAVYALYRREVFDQVGLFNEKLVRHQDTEFHERVRRAGWKFWMQGTAVATYYCRDSVPKLSRQMFDIGYYFADLLKTQYGGLRLRHLAPAAFYGFLLSGLVFATFCPIIILLPLIQFAFYFLIVVFAALFKVVELRNLKYSGIVPIVILMHFLYAMGTYAGFVKTFIFKK